MPCTPLGCIELLDHIGTQIAGKRAVVVGRSNIVGMPAALLLNKRNATVTVCHSATENMADIVRQADIVIAAAGQAEMIKVGGLRLTQPSTVGVLQCWVGLLPAAATHVFLATLCAATTARRHQPSCCCSSKPTHMSRQPTCYTDTVKMVRFLCKAGLQ